MATHPKGDSSHARRSSRYDSPELDEVDKALVAGLEETTSAPASASCRTDIAKAVGEYVSAHEKQVGTLKAIALDRALATACISSLR